MKILKRAIYVCNTWMSSASTGELRVAWIHAFQRNMCSHGHRIYENPCLARVGPERRKPSIVSLYCAKKKAEVEGKRAARLHEQAWRFFLISKTVTLICTARGTPQCLDNERSAQLSGHSISERIIDGKSVRPYDRQTIGRAAHDFASCLPSWSSRGLPSEKSNERTSAKPILWRSTLTRWNH